MSQSQVEAAVEQEVGVVGWLHCQWDPKHLDSEEQQAAEA